METKDFISILDKINNLIEEKEFEQAKMYIEIAKENIKNEENKIENYIDNIIAELQ